MYIHSAVLDQGGDLMLAVQELGLNPREDIAFPINYSPANGVPDETLNAFYNMGDLFLTTHLGEGWGLSITEAMGAGIPVLVPDNTCMRQLCGENEERGYIYPCNDQIWVDNSGYRLKGNIPDIVSKMMECYNHRGEKVQAARDWTTTLTWKDIGKKWVELFDKVLVTKQQEQQATPAKIVSETL
jgi:glycosyltransferase involved in cell wall biosynthesis